ncbi:hypothetical protein K461DRAFT_290587 [Myriangium duriaei CBS 260.36]|uniref:Uncharacterized protein n=1 Tax=Myriangium duriaei CBS 260.36 TaxID=1168546 RepID=A0A9P4J8V4_9PEZI|nr:hypothetical protein K461DRAFT_290587 [Myriangium duriaei CBS 260.36]
MVPSPQRSSEDAKAIARQQSLEDYERNLTVQGDDRRRTSSVNVDKLQEVQKDDRTDSVTQKTPHLTRAAPLLGPRLKSGGNILMEKALEKHQQEKAAMFRVKGKEPKKDSEDNVAEGPVFNMSFGPASSPERIMSGMEDVDPLAGNQGKRSKSMVPLRLHAYRTPTPMPQKLCSISQSTTGSLGSVMVTPPASWARFPSHDRRQRCRSAGIVDSITARDFAPSPTRNGQTTSHSSPIKKRSIRSRLRFSSSSNDSKLSRIWRYYTNLISSGSSYNRRTSVTTGGRLKNPELEMLPPIMSDDFHHEVVVPVATLTNNSNSSRKFSFERNEEAYELRALPGPSKDKSVEPSIDPKTITPETPHQRGAGRSARSQSFQDPALVTDGSGDLLGIPTVFSRPSAQALSEIYQRECVQPPLSDSSTSHDEAAYAASIPLPDTPSRIPTLANRRHKSSAQQLPSAPRALNSPRATLVLRPRTNNASRAPKHAASLHPSDARDVSGVSIRRFPSVTVVDDGKGDWRSVSLITASRSRSGSGSTKGSGSTLGGGHRVPTPMPCVAFAPEEVTLNGRGSEVSKSEESEESEVPIGDVRTSTMELLGRMKGEEERGLEELKRLLTVGLSRGSGER